MTDTATGTAAPKKTRNRKAAPSKSVEDLLASFAPEATPENDPAAAARKERVDGIRAVTADFARTLAGLVQGSKDADNVKGSLVALQTASKRAQKAVATIPDAVLVPATPAE